MNEYERLTDEPIEETKRLDSLVCMAEHRFGAWVGGEI